MKMPPTTCKALLKDYCSNCTFAGVHFIADDTKHWFERLVWVALVALSWYGSAILIIAAWDAFRESPISFGVETTYTKWETKLPSVAVCETENTEKLYSVCDTKPKLLPMISNMRSKSSILKFEVLLPSTMYTLNKEEVPSITSLQSSAMHLQLGHKYRRQVAVRDIDNDLLIVETTPEQRACRFHSENKDGLYPHYSYSACTVLCRKRAQLEVCNCNDHFMLGTPESDRCNVSGLACIHAHASHLTTLKPPWANRPGLSCDCLPSCEETEITIIKDVDVSLRSKKEKTKAYVEMVLAFLPTERFKRIVVRSRLDLVVSIGGTTGLFVGASLLSFVELIIYFTVRFAINIWLERQGRTNKVVIKEDGEDLSNDDILIVFQNRNQGLGYLNGGLHVHDQSDY
ncbi:sodium channel protein Nach-like isoform X3 [Choristoneura fumiferana]|uniref:sodium channel protein Nach-like isoform X3 n=1 Tax=Choristoneura fumiferana TaxID=7141 RepID=UPI003D156DD7